MESKTKECLYCHRQIPEYTNKCPYCKKKQETRAKRIVLGILSGIMVISFGGMLFLSNTVTREPTYSSTEQIESTQDETTVPIENLPSQVLQGNYGIGQTFTTSNVEITLNSVSEWDGGDLYSHRLNDSTEFLMLNFTVRNNSDVEIATYDIRFNGYVDNQNVDLDFAGDDILSGDNLLPGTFETGYIAFIVPKNWNNFMVRVEKYNGDGAIGTFSFNRNECIPYPINNSHHDEHD